MVYTKWSDIRRQHIERIGRAEFEAGKKRMLAEVCGNLVLRDDNTAGITESNHLPGDARGQTAIDRSGSLASLCVLPMSVPMGIVRSGRTGGLLTQLLRQRRSRGSQRGDRSLS